MFRAAIIADIHGNLPALNAVIEEIARLEVDEVWCLGDTVGYGADPESCWRWVKSKCSMVIKGNHEQAVCHFAIMQDFSDNAKASAKFVLSNLSQQSKEEILALPLVALRPDLNVAMTHGAFTWPEQFYYVESLEDARDQLNVLPDKICLVGHTHKPMFFAERMPEHFDTSPKINKRLEIVSGRKHIINPGSVGQPRDGNPQASFGLIEFADDGRRYFTLKRLDYDIKTAYERIMRLGLPEFLANRLFRGV